MSKRRNPFSIGLDALLTSFELFAAENRSGTSVIEAIELEELNLQFNMLGLRADERHEVLRIALMFAQVGFREDDISGLLQQWMSNFTTPSESPTTKEHN